MIMCCFLGKHGMSTSLRNLEYYETNECVNFSNSIFSKYFTYFSSKQNKQESKKYNLLKRCQSLLTHLYKIFSLYFNVFVNR